MSEKEMIDIIDKAAFVVNGYAFSMRNDKRIEILSLDKPDHMMILSSGGEMLETNMDSIEQSIVNELWKKNMQFMEG